MPDKLQSRKKIFFDFSDGKTLPYTLKENWRKECQEKRVNFM